MANQGESGNGPKKPSSISSLFRRVLQIPERDAMKEVLLKLYVGLTGRVQREILEALEDLENGQPVSPVIRRILEDPDVRNATFLTPEIRREIEERIQTLRSGEEPVDLEPPSSGSGRPIPTIVAFKRMVLELGMSPAEVAKVLNRLYFPNIDLTRYPSSTGEPIYISGEEDAGRLLRYAKLETQSLGEALFFARRHLSRNWNLAKAAQKLGIPAEEVEQIEENRVRPTSDVLDKFEQAYGLDREQLENLAGQTLFTEDSQPFIRPLPVTTPRIPGLPLHMPPGVSKGPGSPANLSSEMVSQISFRRLENLHRLLEKPEDMWPFKASEGLHEVMGLALYFAGIVRGLRQQTDRDFLTGTLNRKGLDRLTPKLEQRLLPTRRAQEGNHGRSDWVLMVDIDHFKIINDTYLHQNGDQVLREVAQLLTEGVRSGLRDVVARYGGEEFFIWLGHVGQDVAVRRAEAIRRTIENFPIQINGFPPIHATISVGVAEMRPLPHPEKQGDIIVEGSLRNAIERADRALYEAKRTGRNRIVLSKE
jgi:diguanylate cyclase (GGDEF)-like protein